MSSRCPPAPPILAFRADAVRGVLSFLTRALCCNAPLLPALLRHARFCSVTQIGRTAPAKKHWSRTRGVGGTQRARRRLLQSRACRLGQRPRDRWRPERARVAAPRRALRGQRWAPSLAWALPMESAGGAGSARRRPCCRGTAPPTRSRPGPRPAPVRPTLLRAQPPPRCP
jgi:hypothetical protein